MRTTVATFLVGLAMLGGFVPAAVGAAAPQPLKVPGQPEPLRRVREMLEWLAREQQLDGGWSYRLRLPLDQHVHDARPRPSQSKNWKSKVPDTAMAALALLRAGNTPDQGEYREHAEKAAKFLYDAVLKSPEGSLDVAPVATPFTARIGAHADTFLTLLYFAELRDPRRGSRVGYDGAIKKLVEKVERNQNADGSWGKDPIHAPLLGHALGVWALETASRHGVAVSPEVIARAERYAMSEAAERAEWAANHRWKKDERGLRPRWMETIPVDDDEPVNVELYVMVSRLAVLHQADQTNQWEMSRAVEKMKAAGTKPPPAEVARLRAQLDAANRTRKSLEQGRDAMRRSWIKVHAGDLHPSPAPLLFTGEDFLASMLIVDSMGGAGVEEWFPPVVRRLMQFQDADGGLKTGQHVDCHDRAPKPYQCVCTKFRDRDKQFCPAQKSWCSKDRTFITAAGVWILLAETPYRPAFLGMAKD